MAKSSAQIKAAAVRLRIEADALVVIVLTPTDSFYSADSRLAPADLERTLISEAPILTRHYRESREKDTGGR